MVSVMKVCITKMVCLLVDKGMECGVVERVKYSTLRWFGHRKNARELNDQECK